jgi:hypothetical protein
LKKFGGPKNAKGIPKAAVRDRTQSLVMVDLENPKDSQEFPA